MRKKYVFILAMIMGVGVAAHAQGDSTISPKAVRFQGIGTAGVYYQPTFMASPYLELSLGVRIKERAYIGINAGGMFMVGDFTKCGCNEEYPWVFGGFVPTVSVRGDVYLTQQRKVTPFVTLQVGTWVDGISYSKVGAGLDYKQLTLQIGYQPMIVWRAGVDHGLYLEGGYRFNSVKYNRRKHEKEPENTTGAVRFHGVAEAGFHADFALRILDPTIGTTLGVMIRDRAFVGLGVGLGFNIQRVHDNFGWDWEFDMPFLASLRSDIYLTDGGLLRPYTSLLLGYATSGYCYAKVGMGFDYKQFTMQLGYQPMYNHYSGLFGHGAYIDFGYRFNSVKYNKQKRNEKME